MAPEYRLPGVNRRSKQAILTGLLQAGFAAPGRSNAIMLVLVAVVTAASVLQVARLHFSGDINALIGRDDPVVQVFNEAGQKSRAHDALLMVCPEDFSMTPELYDSLLVIRGVESSLRAVQRPGASSIFPFVLSGDAADVVQMMPVVRAFNDVIAEHGSGCGLAGTPAFFVETQVIFRQDQRRALAVAAVLVIVLFAGLYRIGWLAPLMLVPIGIGITWGLALYGLFRPELTLLAATVPVLLIGIGIDHCVHMIQGTRRALGKGLPRREAVRTAWRRLVRPITTSAVTTAGAFAVLTVAELQGFEDFGWAGALTTLAVFAAVVTLMPWLLMMVPVHWLDRPARILERLPGLAGRVEQRGHHVVRWTVVVSLLALVACAWLETLTDNRKLNPPNMQSMMLQDRIAEEHNYTTKPLLLLLDDAQQAGVLLGSSTRPEKIAAVLPAYGMPQMLRLHPAVDAFDADHYRELRDQVERWLNENDIEAWRLGGGPVINAHLNALMAADAAKMLPLITVVMLLILTVFSRSLKIALLILVPLFLALLWTGGVMAVTATPVSVMSVAIAPLVIGIGVDNGIHLVSSWRRNDGNLSEVFAETGVALMVTTLTTVAAFGAFVTAETAGLAMFGWQAALALSVCLLVTLLVLPRLCGRFLTIRNPGNS